ncbi:MAG: biotin--[acetyl-CoA-carboxylase] ligase [Pseudomonadota bacterium]
MPDDHGALHQFLSALAAGQQLTLEDWPSAAASPDGFALAPDPVSRVLNWPQQPDWLDAGQISAALTGSAVEVLHAVDSTNTRLVNFAQSRDVHRDVCLAECQLSGRGRRGKSWVSPYARNLAMSIGWRIDRTGNELGGLSLAVGLGLLTGLQRLDLPNARLKWPNDIHLGNAKLCGILVELVQSAGLGTQVVAGMGVNVDIGSTEEQSIEQRVTDLRRHGVTQTRSELVVMLLKDVFEALEIFATQGFEPFIEPFNAAHKLHGEACYVIQGERKIFGTVKGVGESGELIMDTDQGEQRFHGGEVSLRA